MREMAQEHHCVVESVCVTGGAVYVLEAELSLPAGKAVLRL